jgi:hypothetical protein
MFYGSPLIVTASKSDDFCGFRHISENGRAREKVEAFIVVGVGSF